MLPAPAISQEVHRTAEILKTFDGILSGLEYISRRLLNGLRRRLIRNRYANLNSRHTFYIQIQEGCSMHCSYCAIRTAIGPLHSLPLDEVLDQFRDGLAQGFHHFQLVGDNAGSYGLDICTNMGRLLGAILALEGKFDLDLPEINPVYVPLIFESVKKTVSPKPVIPMGLTGPGVTAFRRDLKPQQPIYTRKSPWMKSFVERDMSPRICVVDPRNQCRRFHR